MICSCNDTLPDTRCAQPHTYVHARRAHRALKEMCTSPHYCIHDVKTRCRPLGHTHSPMIVPGAHNEAYLGPVHAREVAADDDFDLQHRQGRNESIRQLSDQAAERQPPAGPVHGQADSVNASTRAGHHSRPADEGMSLPRTNRFRVTPPPPGGERCPGRRHPINFESPRSSGGAG